MRISVEPLSENFQNQHNLFVSTDINYPPDFLTLQKELQIYRIIQKVLSNVAKYANAQVANVSIKVEKNEFLLEIKDNGKGFEVEKTLKNGKSFGLHSIIQRSKAINGESSIISSPEGTVITIKTKV